jgi:hypothetical protein
MNFEAVDERICSFRTRWKSNNFTIILVHAPKEGQASYSFLLQNALSAISPWQKNSNHIDHLMVYGRHASNII